MTSFTLGARQLYYNGEIKRRRMELGWSQEEMARRIGISKQSYVTAETLMRTVGGYVKAKICDYFKLKRDVLFPEWLDPYVEARERSTYKEISIDEKMLASSPVFALESGDYLFEESVQINMKKALVDSLEVLRPRDKEIICLRYGLDGNREHTLGEVAKIIGRSSQRVRQIEHKVMRMLRANKEIRRVRELL